MAIEAGKQFQLVAGNMVLDFVNTLDNRFIERGPDELLQSYEDLLRFLLQAGLLSAEQLRRLRQVAKNKATFARAAAKVLKQAKCLRETLAAIAYALVDKTEVPAAEMDRLTKFIREADKHRRLGVAEEGIAWEWIDGDGGEGDAAFPLRLLTCEAADFLLSEQAQLLRACSSEACRWLFLDTSKNHTRRWCDMKICGNRMKARRFQARLAAE